MCSVPRAALINSTSQDGIDGIEYIQYRLLDGFVDAADAICKISLVGIQLSFMDPICD